MTQLYLDSACIIYLVEIPNPLNGPVARRLASHLGGTGASLLTSALSRLECRMKPLKENRIDILRDYDDFFSSERLVVADLSVEIVDKATEVRARYGFKSRDALHLATAIVHRADAFLTGDARLARCAEVRGELVAAS